MAIADDILIDYTNKRIYGTPAFLASSNFYTTLEVYTYVMDTFDEASQMDDAVPFISTTNVLNYFIGNGWYFEQALTKHLKGASIQTNGYLNSIRLLNFGATYTNATSANIGSIVYGVTSNQKATLLDYNNTDKKWWVRMLTSADVFNNTTEQIAVSSTAISGILSTSATTGEEIFSNIYSVGTINNGNAYVYQNGAVLTSWWGVGNNSNHIDVLVKVKEAGSLIDSGNLTIYNRNYGDFFDHASVTVAGGGRTPVPLATQSDALNITLASSAIAAYVHAQHGGTSATAAIKTTFGSFSADINDNSVYEYYICQVDCASQPMSVVYQALQYICDKDRSGLSLNGADARVYTAASSAYTPVKSAPFATMAGSTLIFARGVYPINLGTGTYIATDISGNQITPPNTINVAVTGLVSTDRVSVFLTENSLVKKNQFTSHASSNTSGSNTFVVNETIPKDTPSTGYVRVVDTTAKTEQRYTYSSWTGSTFTLSTPLTQAYDATDTAYVGYIDEQASSSSISKTVQYVSDRSVVVRVRNSSSGGNQIIPFEVASTIANTGLSVPASRSPDYVISN